MSRDNLKGLYGITDPKLLPGSRLLSGVGEALEGGLRLLQYRNKRADQAQQRRECRTLLALCKPYGASLIINDNLELCRDVEAHGVHLGQSDGDVSAARKRLGPDAIIGVTCHSNLELAKSARDQGADYCAFGRCFSSHTKPEAPPCDIGVLGEARNQGLNVVAIGGITLDNIAEVLVHKPQMIAVIHGLFACSDITGATRAFQSKINQE